MTIKEIAWQIIEREKWPYFTSDDYETNIDEHLIDLFDINFDEFKEMAAHFSGGSYHYHSNLANILWSLLHWGTKPNTRLKKQSNG